ncbi:MAG: Uma2 family endonuclease [Kastovskya adunca ATA6-11-RM4]|jgi:Uma2 family endonuclease|nr:Uma2 family endonuclease [Kastovskya adunca ATA6-11-RM4]
MISKFKSSHKSDIIYPDSNGQLVADNTKQFQWIVLIKENLELLFANNPEVFVAGDLLWYPIEGNNTIQTAPDVMVAFGRSKGDRGSYRQWQENNINPQVVFEILSPSNTLKEIMQKFLFYDRYGVEEYYLYDPDKNDFTGSLRAESGLEVIEEIAGWTSPRLGIRFELTDSELQIYRPDGQQFATFVELPQRAEQAGALSQQERALRKQEQRRPELLEQRLRELGVNLEDL